MSPRPLLHLVEDLVTWSRTLGEMAAQRRPGRGTDYLQHRDREIEQELIRRLHPPRMRLRVTEVIQETPGTRTLRFTRIDGELPPFRPGQYVNLFVIIDGVRTSRPYSISSAPGAGHLDLTVREKPGGFVSPFLVQCAAPGDELESTGPQGQFRHEPLIDGDELVLIAGGSGITPFMSLLRDQARHGFRRPAALLYGSRVQQDVIFGGELAELSARHDRFRYRLVLSDAPETHPGPRGLLDEEQITALLGGPPAGQTFLLCGPNPMLKLCTRSLERLGVPRHRVRIEVFGPPEDITAHQGWPRGVRPDTVFQVEVAGRATLPAPAGEPLLNTLERGGLVVPAVCRKGACSACRTRLIEGEVFMPAGVGLRQSDREAGYIHACAAYPITDLKIRFF